MDYSLSDSLDKHIPFDYPDTSANTHPHVKRCSICAVYQVVIDFAPPPPPLCNDSHICVGGRAV